MDEDRELLADILRAAAKLLAQDAVNRRVRFMLLRDSGEEQESVYQLNAAARCLILADKYNTEGR